MSNLTTKLALSLYKKMSPKGQALNLEELRSLLDKVPMVNRKQVDSVLSNHIFKNQSFEIDSRTFIQMFCAHFKVKQTVPIKRHKKKPSRVAISLKDIVDLSKSESDLEEETPLTFTERLVLRLEKRKATCSSLRKILDGSEAICENITQILKTNSNDIDKDLKDDLIAVRNAYNQFCNKYVP